MNLPRSLGYRMPAEWEPHAATWLTWPRRDCVSFRFNPEPARRTFAALVALLAPHEPVELIVADAATEADARAMLREVGTALDQVRFHLVPANEPWCRDHGPTFLTGPAGGAVVDWDYNAYGGKFTPHDSDDAVPARLAALLGLPLFRPGMVLEGGSIEVNGAGLVLTTEACLLHPNRNPQLGRAEVEQRLRDYLGVATVLWLGGGLAGDDTDGHVDNLARFVGTATVVAAVEEDPRGLNYEVLQDNLRRLRGMPAIERVVELPMPGAVSDQRGPLPASYANFYVANGLVVMPTFRHPHDARALAILQECFPERRVVGLDSTELIRGGGSFHCITQQQPAY